MSIKQTLKAITKSEWFRKYLCWMGAQYIRFVRFTSRIEVVNGHIPQKFWDEDRPFILAFWHGRIIMMPYCWDKNHKIHMLISQHRDGQIIARTIAPFGIDCIAGSSSKGGANAIRAMLKTIKAGESIGITPDGPRGPRMRASSGIINVAKMSGVPIIACSGGSTRRKHLSSWDRFCVCLPFSKSVFVWGEPIYVPKDSSAAELDTLQLMVENTLNHVTNETDRLTGHPNIEPAERKSE
jgi:lysophospholipid acyltransferase (LPLAT)-like uncharacterized protein